MVKPNYNFAKRQRELAKKAKKEEKQQRKAGVGNPAEGEAVEPGTEAPADALHEEKPAA